MSQQLQLFAEAPTAPPSALSLSLNYPGHDTSYATSYDVDTGNDADIGSDADIGDDADTGDDADINYNTPNPDLLEQTRKLFQHDGSNAELMTQVMHAIKALNEICEQEICEQTHG